MRLTRIRADLRSQRYGIAIAALALLVALGAPAHAAQGVSSAASSVAKALKLAKKADKRSTQALKLAQQVSAKGGPAGKDGAQGVPGPQGPAGPPGSDATINGVAAGGDLAGTYPNPTIGAGKIGSSALQSGAVTPDKLGIVPAVRAQSPSESYNSDQILNSGDVPEPLQFDEELYDTATVHQTGQYSATGSYFTAPRAGLYEVSAGVIFSDPGSNYGTKRQLYLLRDPDTSSSGGEEYIAGDIVAPQNPGATVMNVSGVTSLSQGDVVQAWVSHNATADLQTVLSQAGLIGDGRHFLSMTWLGPAS